MAADYEQLRHAVRGFVGGKVSKADHADEIVQNTFVRLLERADAGEVLRNPEAAAITQAKYSAHEFFDAKKADRRNQQDARAVLKPRRGKKIGSRSTSEDGEGHADSVRLPNAQSGRGRPRKDAPRRRQPVLILFPDGATALLPKRKDQIAYRSKPASEPPSSLMFVVAFCADLPPGPWDPLRLLRQALDRERWRDAERAVRAPRKGR